MTQTIEPKALKPGDHVRFGKDRRWWTVRAADGERYTILTRQGDFAPKGELWYTIIDAQEGIRGAADTIGHGWDRHMSDEAAQDLMDSLHGRARFGAEVSHRNRVPLVIADRRPADHG